MTLSVEGLCFSYPGKPVLRAVDLTVEPGELVCVVGPNGSGKSTLVKCIDGLLSPSSGSVWIGTDEIRGLRRRDLARRVGYVPQEARPMYSGTVFETALMGRKPHAPWRFSRRDVELVAHVLVVMGLDDVAREEFMHLSGGQRQRVMIARALVQEPRMLLLDEPTSALDIAHQLETMELIRRVSRTEGPAVVMVVHDLNLAARYADRVVVLSDGAVHAAGPPAAVFTPETVADVFGVEIVTADHLGKPSIVPIRRVAAKSVHHTVDESVQTPVTG